MDVCLKCGTESPLVSQICHDCLRQIEIVAEIPDILRMVCCKSCFSLKIPGNWIEFSDLNSSVSHFIEISIVWNNKVIKSESQISLNQLDPNKFNVKVMCQGNYSGVNLSSIFNKVVEIKYQVCQVCSRRAGGYYESILQLRTKRKEILDKTVNLVYDTIESAPVEFFTGNSGPVKGGYDFQLSSTEKARSLAREIMVKFGGHVTETNTLVGRKDGRDLLRHTFGVRLPRVLVNDYIFRDEQVYHVVRLNRRKVKLKQITHPYNQKMVEVDNLRNISVLDIPLDVQIVSHHKNEYLLLDPFTLQTIEAQSPQDWIGDKITAVRYGNETFFIWI